MEAGELLARIYTNKEEILREAEQKLKRAYEIDEVAPNKYEHILGII